MVFFQLNVTGLLFQSFRTASPSQSVNAAHIHTKGRMDKYHHHAYREPQCSDCFWNVLVHIFILLIIPIVSLSLPPMNTCLEPLSQELQALQAVYPNPHHSYIRIYIMADLPYISFADNLVKFINVIITWEQIVYTFYTFTRHRIINYWCPIKN